MIRPSSSSIFPVLIALLVVLAPILFVAPQSREEGIKAIQSRLLEVPTAQYRLTASANGRGYQFCNTSPVGVLQFRLGCADRKNGKLRILSEREFENGDLPRAEAGYDVSCRLWDSNHGFFPGEPCKKGRLAIVEVLLENGRAWTLKE